MGHVWNDGGKGDRERVAQLEAELARLRRTHAEDLERALERAARADERALTLERELGVLRRDLEAGGVRMGDDAAVVFRCVSFDGAPLAVLQLGPVPDGVPLLVRVRPDDREAACEAMRRLASVVHEGGRWISRTDPGWTPLRPAAHRDVKPANVQADEGADGLDEDEHSADERAVPRLPPRQRRAT